jgi:hypothetical protein
VAAIALLRSGMEFRGGAVLAAQDGPAEQVEPDRGSAEAKVVAGAAQMDALTEWAKLARTTPVSPKDAAAKLALFQAVEKLTKAADSSDGKLRIRLRLAAASAHEWAATGRDVAPDVKDAIQRAQPSWLALRLLEDRALLAPKVRGVVLAHLQRADDKKLAGILQAEKVLLEQDALVWRLAVEKGVAPALLPEAALCDFIVKQAAHSDNADTDLDANRRMVVACRAFMARWPDSNLCAYVLFRAGQGCYHLKDAEGARRYFNLALQRRGRANYYRAATMYLANLTSNDTPGQEVAQ